MTAAPAAYDTIKTHLDDTGRTADYYDAIVTGDLGSLGHEIVRDFFAKDGVKLGASFMDCGLMIYDLESQDVQAGGSGCGCGAVVLTSHLLPGIAEGRWKNVLFAATGALMSPTTTGQGESIPGICHAVAISATR